MESNQEELLKQRGHGRPLSFNVTLSWDWKDEKDLDMWRAERIGFQTESSENAKALRLLVEYSRKCTIGMFLCMRITICLYLCVCTWRQVGHVGLCSFHKMERSVSLWLYEKNLSVCAIQQNWVPTCAGHNANTAMKGQTMPLRSSQHTSEHSRVAQCGACTSRGMCWYKNQHSKDLRADLLRDQ